MDSSERLRLQLAKQLECTRNNICIGPTGLTGPTGPEGPTGPAGYQKLFTLYLDFSSGTALKRIYIPPGFSTSASLAAGGIFTADSPPDLVFFGTTNITIQNTTYAFPVGLYATGYITSKYWSPVALSVLGGGNLTWQNTVDNVLSLKGVTPGRVNGGNVAVYPTTGVLAGWLGTLTIYYL
jgi:hypothetical protein